MTDISRRREKRISTCFSSLMGHRLLILLFMVLLCLPMSVTLFTEEADVDLGENRHLAQWPRWEKDPVSTWPDKIESACQDRFGFRGLLIQARSLFYLHVLHMSPHPKIILGREDWLYFKGEDRLPETAISDYQGVRSFTPEALAQIAENLEAQKQWLERRGIRMITLVAPNKESIYPEFLPKNLRRYRSQSRQDQLLEYLRAHTQAEVLDMRQDLLQGKGLGLLYYKQDTHWNDLGSFLAYQRLMAGLRSWFPDLKPLVLKDFAVKEKPRAGDLLCMMGFRSMSSLWEDVEVMKPLKALSVEEISSDLDPRYPWPSWEPSQSPITMENPSQDLRAVVFCDSFLRNSFVRTCLASHFRHSDFLSMRPNIALLEMIIPQERPDVVIVERVERTLCEMPDASETPEPQEKDLDRDRDNMSDEWESAFGLDPSRPEDAGSDLDSDLFSTLEEYEARTRPNDPTSRPSVTATGWIQVEGPSSLAGSGLLESPPLKDLASLPSVRSGTRLILGQVPDPEQRWAGISLVNPDRTQASRVVLKGYDQSGRTVGSMDLFLKPMGQRLGLVSGLWGIGEEFWLEAEAEGPIAGGMFFGNQTGLGLAFFPALTGESEAVLPLIKSREPWWTTFQIINPHETEVQVQISCIRSSGELVQGETLLVGGKAMVRRKASAYESTGLELGWMKFTSSMPVAVFATMGRPKGLIGMAAVSPCPVTHLAGPPLSKAFACELIVVNPGEAQVSFTTTLWNPDGEKNREIQSVLGPRCQKIQGDELWGEGVQGKGWISVSSEEGAPLSSALFIQRREGGMALLQGSPEGSGALCLPYVHCASDASSLLSFVQAGQEGSEIRLLFSSTDGLKGDERRMLSPGSLAFVDLAPWTRTTLALPSDRKTFSGFAGKIGLGEPLRP